MLLHIPKDQCFNHDVGRAGATQLLGSQPPRLCFYIFLRISATIMMQGWSYPIAGLSTTKAMLLHIPKDQCYNHDAGLELPNCWALNHQGYVCFYIFLRISATIMMQGWSYSIAGHSTTKAMLLHIPKDQCFNHEVGLELPNCWALNHQGYASTYS